MQISSQMQRNYNTFTQSIKASKNGDEYQELDKFKENNEKQNKNDPNKLSEEEKVLVSKLKTRDVEVRAHEAAHLAAAGGIALGGASFTYQKGPDGKQYAIGGEVHIDTSPESTPEATIQKARKIKAAAIAPANPSGQDIQVASSAAMMEMRALMELSSQRNNQNPYETPQNDEQKTPLDIMV